MLRILPWITDGAVSFLEGWIESHHRKSELKVFEFGTGNSTLWYLAKNCHVTTVDDNPKWTKTVNQAAEAFGIQNKLISICSERPYSNQYQNDNYDLIMIDGRDRVECLKKVLAVGFRKDSLLVLDNTERIASGEYVEYLQLLKGMKLIHFEQPLESGKPLTAIKDRAGQKVGHRWITTIAYDESVYFYTSAGKRL